MDLKRDEKGRFVKGTGSGKSPEKARNDGRKGGIISGEVKRKNKSTAEIWEVIRKMPLRKGEKTDIDDILALEEVSGANITVEDAMLLAMAKNAMKGDNKAFDSLMKQKEKAEGAELEKRRLEAEIRKMEMENERLQIQLDAYKKAVEEGQESRIVIVDDIPEEIN